MPVPMRRILVATDYSPSAKQALNYACAIANSFNAELHILHVMMDPLPLAVPEGGLNQRDKIIAELLRKAEITHLENTQHLPSAPEVKVLRVVREGYPVNEIRKYAADQQIDLIVLGTQGHSGLSRLLLGSVAEKTVRLASCPVLTVHGVDSSSTDETFPKQISPRRILVATDFSPAASRARDFASSLATKFKAELHLLHVVEIPPPIPSPDGLWISPANVTQTDVDAALRKIADNIKDLELAPDIQIIPAARIGYPVEAITQYIAENEVDLIVLGTQGHRGLAHVLLGSVAEKIVRLATCPVLTMHPL